MIAKILQRIAANRPVRAIDSNGTHWWRKPGIQTLAELEAGA